MPEETRQNGPADLRKCPTTEATGENTTVDKKEPGFGVIG